MYKIISSSSFKKSLKRYKNNQRLISRIKETLECLKSNNKLPVKYKEHELKGSYANFLECHICPDLLLIYRRIKTEKLIVLHNIGSHSYLFK